ncbi:GGDEF domain-containing protein [Radiobacillus sp. PE A8.2]|uniref:GGDEF domain-containing protein n=1 Tax=Radiobacillus sp. PE A8.2 TaxID=3380349 RepID=UPI00388DFD0E
MISRRKQISLWVAWLCIWPVILMKIPHIIHSETSVEWLGIIAFGLLMCIIAFFPLIVNNTPVFFINAVGFAVFLYYGILAEVILTQIAVLVLFFKLRIGISEHYRLPANLLMFLCVSVLSAFVYRLLGGGHGIINYQTLQGIIPVIGYVISAFVTNQLIIMLFKRIINGQAKRIFDKDLIWDLITTALTLPVGLILYILYADIGVTAIFYVGVPFISISFIFTLYYKTQNINYYLKRTSEIGHELTGQLEVNEVIDLFVERVTNLLPVDYAFVYEVVNDEYLELSRFHDTQKKLPFPGNIRLNKFESISGNVWGRGESVHYQSHKEWDQMDVPDLQIVGESIVSLPVERNNHIVAVVTLVSKRKGAYLRYQIMILEILTNYLAVSITNANNYEKTKFKSERDSLTNLYNYRYMEEYLDQFFEKSCKSNNERASLILLDLDHFKAINDTYGHESGNEILQQLATRLLNVVGEEGTVARYGGEEFVVLLPGIDQGQSEYVANAIHSAISDIPFQLDQHILIEESQISVEVTASIGVASYPDHCEDPRELVRHADRAMYVGAKQKGRNKVAVYEKMINV